MTSPQLPRRSLLLAGLGVIGVGALAACTSSGAGHAGDAAHATNTPHIGMDMGNGKTIGPVPSAGPSAGQKLVTATLTPKRTTLDLGGVTVDTWAYGDSVPGQAIRATAGDFLRVTVDNQLPADTTVHWHGIRLRNAADGVPGVTQDAIRPGARYVYEFTAPDPGTFFFHPHVGLQLDRGLYAPLILDDPAEPGGYDAEWVVVLDDWLDGVGTTPDDVLAKLIADGGPANGNGGMDGMGGMGGMDHGGMGGMNHGMGQAPWGDAGDVTYPHYLINGKTPTDPTTLSAKPGQRVRLRVINAASDSIFTVALGGHRMTLTHADGHPVQPTEVGAFYIGMGERYDAIVTLGDGAFPLVAAPFGKQGHALAVVRTGAGAAPGPDAMPSELGGQVFLGSRLLPSAGSRLPDRAPDATVNLTLNGAMKPYLWGMNGAPYGKNSPLLARAGQRLRINVVNMTMMSHPLHLHGPAFALADTGLRKDTLLLAPMESRQLDLDPEVGDWMVHCHNTYHAEAGMMILLSATA